MVQKGIVLWEIGQVVSTPGALDLFGGNLHQMLIYLGRHITGDWGDVDAHAKKENDFSVENGLRVLSAYHHNGTKFWIITEADRSVTTFLLPEEY